jgi:molecular chaperone GrpE
MTNDHEDKDIEEEVVAEEEDAGVLIKNLKEQLKAAQKERDDYLAGWQRAKADFINARREEDQSRHAFIKIATQVILRDFLALADSFMQAMHTLPEEEKSRIIPLYEQLQKLLGDHGVKEIETKSGDHFDPALHEALEGEGEEVTEVLQKGYMLHERVLRPTRVRVVISNDKNFDI